MALHAGLAVNHGDGLGELDEKLGPARLPHRVQRRVPRTLGRRLMHQLQSRNADTRVRPPVSAIYATVTAAP
jgi:hypothetical protein